MSRVLFQVVHHPKPEHRDDVLGAMRAIAEKAPSVAGLDEIGAFAGPDGETIIAISVWASPEAMQAGMAELFSTVAGVPLDAWEIRPREAQTLTQVA